MNIVEALDEIDILFANEIDSQNKFKNKEAADKVYNGLVSMKEYILENHELHKRYKVLANAFISAANEKKYYDDTQTKKDAENYFAWLQGEKNIASNPNVKISMEEATRLNDLANLTGHKPRKEVEKVIKQANNTNNLPKKISFIDKLRGKLNNLFKPNLLFASVKTTGTPKIFSNFLLSIIIPFLLASSIKFKQTITLFVISKVCKTKFKLFSKQTESQTTTETSYSPFSI